LDNELRSGRDEFIAVRNSLQRLSERLGFGKWEENLEIGNLFRTDFYIPEKNLLIEINGPQHVYPYTQQHN
jgi:very-short-patch-repair endonuclease